MSSRKMTFIPKTVHYVFGMASDFGGKPWGLVHHACLMSAIDKIKPDRVVMHCAFEPSGPWWQLSRAHLDVNMIEAPTEIYGRPLTHVAHRAGVTRLKVLIENGGIYLDSDVIVHRSFDALLNNQTVLGREGEHTQYGMADAIILAQAGSPFLKRWLEEYRWFRSKGRDQYWAEHAVEVPSRLANAYPNELKILPYTDFYWPLWTENHLRWIYRSTDAIDTNPYANHLWEAAAYDYFKDLTPGRVRRFDTNFHRWLAPHVAQLPDNYGAESTGLMAEIRYYYRRAGIAAVSRRNMRRSHCK